MATKAIQRSARRFNPGEYRQDMIDLIKTNPELAAKSATTVASRKVRAENSAASDAEDTRNLIAAIVTFGVMGATGAWQGSMAAKRDAIIDDWELEGAERAGVSLTDAPVPWSSDAGVGDPTKWWVIPKMLVVPLGTGILAVIAASMRKRGAMAGALEKSMTFSAIGTFGMTLASLVADFAYRRKEKKIAQGGPVVSVKSAA